MFHRSLSTFLGHARVRQVVLVVAPGEESQVRSDLGQGFGSLLASKRLIFAHGGAERWISVRQGIAALDPSCQWVAIHDVARPFLQRPDIDAVLAAAEESGAATLAIPCPDTVKWSDGAASPLVEQTLDRARIWLTQTPQVFRRDRLEEGYRLVETDPSFTPTDEASIAERMGLSVRLVRGADRLRKVTGPEDLEWARWWASKGEGGI